MAKPKVEYSIEMQQSSDAIRGNCMASGDAEADEECAVSIERQLARGNDWGWCDVRVTATLEFAGRTYTGFDALGQCSYKDERDFKRCGYYKDMCATALADLRANVMCASGRDLREAEEAAECAVRLADKMGW